MAIVPLSITVTNSTHRAIDPLHHSYHVGGRSQASIEKASPREQAGLRFDVQLWQGRFKSYIENQGMLAAAWVGTC